MMMRKYSEVLIHYNREIIVIGIFIFMARESIGLGMWMGWMMMWLGACGGAFQKWRSEPGLWMLGGMFLIFSGIALLAFAYGSIQEVIQGHFTIALDYFAASIILTIQLLFLGTVTQTNWPLKHGMHLFQNEQGPPREPDT